MHELVKLEKKFTNPWRSLRRERNVGDICRLQTDVPKEVHYFFKRLRQEPSTIETTVNILYAKLYNTLIERGIIDFTSVDRFEDFVARCELVLPRSTNDSVVPTPETHNVGAGTTEGSSAPTNATGQPPSVPSGSATKRGRQSHRG